MIHALGWPLFLSVALYLWLTAASAVWVVWRWWSRIWLRHDIKRRERRVLARFAEDEEAGA